MTTDYSRAVIDYPTAVFHGLTATQYAELNGRYLWGIWATTSKDHT